MKMGRHLLKCWLWKALWGLAVLCFVLAWVSVLRQAPIGQFDPLFLFWNALILGILAVPIKLDCQTCETCTVSRPSGM
ncbi:MAG TPA: hypothetical protein VNM40_02515 [Candidatus Paceibacterota bacterium]|nr:hypothetical protein [Candidatus Paceibacterota bacterium]